MEWNEAIEIAKKELGYSQDEWIDDFDEVVEEAKEILRQERELNYYYFMKYKKNIYNEYMQSEKWDFVRKEVFNRDEWTCVECDNKATDCHHKNYTHFGMGNNKEVKDCISLCHQCHMKIHGRED